MGNSVKATRYLFIILFVFISTVSWGSDDDQLTISINGKQNSLSLATLKKKLRPRNVTSFSDPVYKRDQKFEAFDLESILKLMGPLPSNGKLTFSTSDGYTPKAQVDLATLKSQKAYVAFCESKNKKCWTDVQQGDQWVSPAPFYLFWSTTPKFRQNLKTHNESIDEVLPWPYQLSKISVGRVEAKKSTEDSQGGKSSSVSH